MPITNVDFYPPREFEIEHVTVKEGSVSISPFLTGRNRYVCVGHVVVRLGDGGKRTSSLEVNTVTGELRLMRLARPGDKQVKPAPVTPQATNATAPSPPPTVPAAAPPPVPAPAVQPPRPSGAKT
jgi:hypothetical protein